MFDKKRGKAKKIPENSGIFFVILIGANRFCEGWLASSGLPPEHNRHETR